MVSLFTGILGRLRQAVAVFVARQAEGPLVVMIGTRVYAQVIAPSPHAIIPTATWLLLTERLGRLAQRFRALVARLQAGRLAPPRAPRAGIRAARPPAPRLPAERGWINARVAEAAPCAGQLQMLIQDPATADLLARAPQAGRLLRPLCRALALDLPDWLRLPPRAKTKGLPVRRKPRRPAAPRAKAAPRRSTRPVWYPSPPRARKTAV